MYSGHKWTTKLRFFASVCLIYAATGLFVAYSFWPGLFSSKRPVYGIVPVAQPVAATPQKAVTSGKPVRVAVPSLDIDLVVKDGEYNPVDQSWTLSSKDAHFALPTALANDHAGNTLIYGHNNRFVFGPLRDLKPGDKAIVYTDNKHAFTYRYTSSEDLKPDDVSIFSYGGPPILTLQTCSGNWYELRRMYTFELESVK